MRVPRRSFGSDGAQGFEMTAELLDLSAYVRAGDAKELIGGSWKSLRSLVRCGEVAALPTPLGRLYRRADLERLRTLRQREEP